MHEMFDKTGEKAGITAWKHRGNGLEVLVLPDHTAPVAAFMVTYRVGSRNESAGLTGATHYLEHLMFKGSSRFNKELGTTIFQTLQRVGAQVNATTWNDRTNYYEVLPSDRLDLAMQVEADRMRGALLDEADIESERTVILNELDRGENEPIRKLYQTVWSVAYVAHPYHHPTIGWRHDVETVSPDGLRGFYNTYYWPDNATVSVIGDTSVEAALEGVHRHFGGINKAPEPMSQIATREPEQVGERSVEVRMRGELGATMLAFKSPPGTTTDADALSMLGAILSRGKGSRLYRSLVDTGTVTSISAGSSRFRDPGLFYVLGMLAPGKTHEEVEDTILDVLASVAESGVEESEISRAMSNVRAQEAYLRDGPFAVAAQLNEAIAAGDWTLYPDHLARMEAVTAADVQRVAAQYLVRMRMTRGRFVPLAG
ncbi:MAG: insulinase family protein [Rhodothermales bacterium]|nr:insulinase family protein [Rhodothermales bacterium]MBO6779724.1 insulinase family protein [Rhodothermales bacterium]